MGGPMSGSSEAQRAVLATVRQQLSRIGLEQQQLADDLAGLMGAAAPDGLVRRMQAFDLLRQRVDLMAAVLGVLETTPPAGLAEAVPACLTLDSLRRDFAQALGVGEAVGEVGEDVELF